MVSPLAKQRKKLLEKQANQFTPEVPGVNTDSLHIKLIEFEEDRAKLRSKFNSIGARIEHKRDVLIPKYKPLVEAYLESGQAFENPIFSNLIVWLFDVKDMDTAIDWLTKAIEMDVPTPESFKRGNWQTICADETLAWAMEQSKCGHAVEPYFSIVKEKIFNEWDIHEAIKAQYLKFEAFELLMNDDREPQPTFIGNVDVLKKSIELMQQAENTHAKAQVSTMRKKAEQRIRALETQKNL